MTIAETTNQGKGVDTGQKGEIRRLPRDVILVAILALVSTGSFGLGIVAGWDSGGGEGKVLIEKEEAPEAAPAAVLEPVEEIQSIEPAPAPKAVTGGQYVGSKTGTKYYLPWCGTAKRIKDENRVWFATKAEAEARGYEPAKNCKGI